MSLAGVQPYVTKQLEALGYKEHIDPFNDENVPSNVIDGTFHQLLLPISSGERNNSSVQLSVPVQVKTFLKGYRNPNDGLTESITKAEEIISKVLDFKEFIPVTSPKINSVLLDSLNFEPYSRESNDNLIVSVFVFNFIIYICTE